MFGCTYGRSKVALCPHAIGYKPYYFYSRYPLERTKLWNLVKLLTPSSWFAYFVTIISVILYFWNFLVVVYHFHGTMQTIITSSLRPVDDKFHIFMMSSWLSKKQRHGRTWDNLRDLDSGPHQSHTKHYLGLLLTGPNPLQHLINSHKEFLLTKVTLFIYVYNSMCAQ